MIGRLRGVLAEVGVQAGEFVQGSGVDDQSITKDPTLVSCGETQCPKCQRKMIRL